MDGQTDNIFSQITNGVREETRRRQAFKKVCKDHGCCDTVSGNDCYFKPTQDSCWITCESYRTNISGCLYGDRIRNCVSIKHRDCYKRHVSFVCCESCKSIESKYFSGCLYGDIATDCVHEHCRTYTKERYRQCCFTCKIKDDMDTTASKIPAPTTERNYVPGRVTPVAVGIGAPLFLTLFIVAVFVFYWRRKRPLPITDEMYRNYKITKRSPMPLPRETPHDQGQHDSGTAVYTYGIGMPSQDGQYNTANPTLIDALPSVSTGEIERTHAIQDGYLIPIYGDPIRLDNHGYLTPFGERAHYTEMMDT